MNELYFISCCTNYIAMKLNRERRYGDTVLDLGTSWRWSASRTARFTPKERAPVLIVQEAG
jgi:hypothetical protein